MKQNDKLPTVHQSASVCVCLVCLCVYFNPSLNAINRKQPTTGRLVRELLEHKEWLRITLDKTVRGKPSQAQVVLMPKVRWPSTISSWRAWPALDPRAPPLSPTDNGSFFERLPGTPSPSYLWAKCKIQRNSSASCAGIYCLAAERRRICLSLVKN